MHAGGQSIPYLKDARNQGNMTHLQKDKLLLSRNVYRLNLSKKLPDTQQLIQVEQPCYRSASVCVTAVKSRC